ncbi:MAG TPA: glycerol-3-phosphate dehydrogenase/oxidase [Longimicrobiales bacterium]|nr:glycerol-3-phosphate dehydrogenase/oxidase [Longimicrobiales bacterium]
MRREAMLQRLAESPHDWDLLVVGGGATGVGVALDAASRGHDVVLLEGSDFGKGTSSRSTKLVHGGVRYLQQGNVPLVMEALKERGILRRNAPHLVRELPFVVPNYKWWEAPFYGIGMRVYDVLAGKYGFGASRNLSLEETVERIPTIETEGLRGGVVYHDGQFDDARLLVALAVTAVEQGAVLLNYARVVGILKDADGFACGVTFRDEESGEERELRGKVVVNATGAFTDEVRRLDDPTAKPVIRPSQGVHVVLDRSFLPGDSAIMVPHTDDGRVLFAIPWQDRVLVGTTDTPLDEVTLEPRPLPEEVDFILEHARRYLEKDPRRSDVRSVFAGIRPLVAAEDAEDTSEISREHAIRVSDSGLLTIAGGKWTTYRKMAEDTVDVAQTLGDLESRPCVTRDLDVHGRHDHAERFGELAPYGSDAPRVRELLESGSGMGERLHPDLPLRAGEVVWFVREEMARTVDDVLARRSRSLILDARAAREAAPGVARLLAGELGRETGWIEAQVAAFETVVEGYVVE